MILGSNHPLLHVTVRGIDKLAEAGEVDTSFPVFIVFLEEGLQSHRSSIFGYVFEFPDEEHRKILLVEAPVVVTVDYLESLLQNQLGSDKPLPDVFLCLEAPIQLLFCEPVGEQLLD